MIRMLCEDPFNSGGAGYTLSQVAQMTPDQVWFRLCDKDILKDKRFGGRVRKMNTMEMGNLVDKHGMIKVKTEDGTVKRVPFSAGKSKAQILREKLMKEKKEQAKRGT